jgi:glutathione S-transferase
VSLKLYYHPLASFCQKALVALYENDIDFERDIVDLGDERERARFEAVWPLGQFPVLRDEARDRTVPESTIVIEYLDAYYAKRIRLVPTDAERAWQCRLWDRFYDFHVQEPMQKIVLDKLRPEGAHDPHGVEHARASLHRAYAVADEHMRTRTWALGDELSMADCAAAPALFYATLVVPLDGAFPALAAYDARLKSRPSFVRVVEEAKPYFAMFPG